ncbi:MAG: lipid-A-disaccharide synthase [Verrucomicrobia bacterium]|nr:lipid-A-disaccharide synthase [Verrucomicrobiota bacterium]
MKFYVVAGEASGDSRGVELMRALRELRPGIEFLGAGGREMKAFAGDAIFDWADEAVVGLWDVLKKYGYFRSQFHRMLAEIEAAKPDALITIDYPGFNMRLAKEAKLRMPKLRTIHYISPQVWAWHRGRIPKMAEFLDLMLCLFPFELPLYADAGLRAVCVGHPLLDSLETEKKEQVRDASLVALLPGSRSKEVRKIFPIMIEAAKMIKRSSPSLRFEVAAAREVLADEMRAMLATHGCDEGFSITLRSAHDLMQRAGAGMVCSGTATLESTFFGLPMVILYKVAWLTWFVGKRLVKIPWLGLPNVLAGREIIREFLQDAAKPEPIIAELSRLLGDSSVREEQQRAQAAVIASLGERGAARRAAEAILAG